LMLTDNDHLGEKTPSFTDLSELALADIAEWALEYSRRGFVVTPLDGKKPVLRRWQKQELEVELTRHLFVEGRNIGVVLGGPSGIVDIDLDNPVAAAATDLLFPNTVKSGRKKSLRLHRWYLCYPAPAPRKYALPKPMAERLGVDPGEDVLVELRSTGQQTMVPPSMHPVSGDRCIWYPGEICEMDGRKLADLVLDVAVAALLALNGPVGSREWYAIHAAGYLYPRLGPERAEKIVEAASVAYDDEEHDERMRAVHSFLRKPVDDDAPMTEGLLVAELEKLAPGVPALIKRWCARDRRDGGGGR
jgi:hypothetical protein